MPGKVLTVTPTPKDIKDRLLALFTLLTETEPDVLGSIDLDGECAIDDDYLPVLIGLMARGVIGVEKRGTQITGITQNYQFRVLYAKVESASLSDQLAAAEIAEARMLDIPGWLARYPLLQANAKGMSGVRIAGFAANDNGAEVQPWRGADWSCVTYLMPVTVNVTR